MFLEIDCMLLVIQILLGFVMLSGMISGLFTKSFCFKLSYSKTRKLRASLENHLAALKLNLNKKGVWKADLNFFASVSCFKARNEVGFGLTTQYVLLFRQHRI